MIDYDAFEQRREQVLSRLSELRQRQPDPREARLPETVADRVWRAARAMMHADNAIARAGKARDHEYESQEYDKAMGWLVQAERELQLADELIEELGR